MRSASHALRALQALWLANTSSVILFYPYLKASMFTPIKQLLGRTMVFKTTLKGAAARAESFKLFAPAALISAVNIATFIAGVATFNISVNAAQAISMCWIVFNTVPHVTLMFYASFGPGSFMVAWCRVGMALTGASGALAVILMWLLYPRDVSFDAALRGSIQYMQAGPLATPAPICAPRATALCEQPPLTRGADARCRRRCRDACPPRSRVASPPGAATAACSTGAPCWTPPRASRACASAGAASRPSTPRSTCRGAFTRTASMAPSSSPSPSPCRRACSRGRSWIYLTS